MTKEAILARLRAMASTPGATEQQQKDAATAVSYAKGLGFDNSRFTDEDSQMQAHSLVAFWVAEGKTEAATLAQQQGQQYVSLRSLLQIPWPPRWRGPQSPSVQDPPITRTSSHASSTDEGKPKSMRIMPKTILPWVLQHHPKDPEANGTSLFEAIRSQAQSQDENDKRYAPVQCRSALKADESRIAGALEWPLTLLDECQQYARWDSDVTVKVAQIVALFEEMTIGVHVTESQSGRFQPPISRGENTSLRQDFCLLAWEEPSLVAGARQCALSENAVDEELASFKVGYLAQSSKMLMTCEVKKPQKMMHNGVPIDPQTFQTCDPPLPQSVIDSIYRILSQVFAYLVVTGAEFAIVSCFEVSWLCCRPMDDCYNLYVSPPILHSHKLAEDTVTAMAAFHWIQAQAIKRTLEQGLRHQCLNQCDFVAVKERLGVIVSGQEKGAVAEEEEEEEEEEEGEEEEEEKAAKRQRIEGGAEGGGPSISAAKESSATSSLGHTVRVSSAKPLGKGASGIVLPATLENQAPVAVKIYCLCEDSNAAAGAEAAFYQKMGRIQGKHIPTYYGLGRLPFTGDAFLTMSVVSGRSLFDLKESGHPYSDELGEAATASLEAVHSFGVVHGDIRLQNFILHVEGSKEREELRLLLSEWMNSMSK